MRYQRIMWLIVMLVVTFGFMCNRVVVIFWGESLLEVRHFLWLIAGLAILMFVSIAISSVRLLREERRSG